LARLLERGARPYFTPLYGKDISLQLELLREAPTQSGLAYPKYYVWARVLKSDQLLSEGAMRLAVIETNQPKVTDYLTKQEIISNPARLDAIFSSALIPKIKEKAGIK